MRKVMPLLAALFLLGGGAEAAGQARMIEPGPSGTVNVTFDHPDDEPMAVRLRDLVFRVKRVSDVLHEVKEINVTLVHTQRELDLQLGPERAGEAAGASYVRGILYLSPLSWSRNPTDEALEAEMEQVMVRYSLLQLTGGHRVAPWLEDGLVAYLTRQQFAPSTAGLLAGRADVLLASRGAQEPAVGYWAVRYLIEERGGIPALQRLLRTTARRPDTFLENLEVVYAASTGELELEWRGWLNALVEEDRLQREGGVRRGPDRPR